MLKRKSKASQPRTGSAPLLKRRRQRRCRDIDPRPDHQGAAPLAAISSMAPASLMTLPNELLYKICENLSEKCTFTLQFAHSQFSSAARTLSRHTLSRHALSRLSKTCRRLREVAQPVLFHYVWISKDLLFLRTIIARPDLAAHVRELHYDKACYGNVRRYRGVIAAIRAHKQLPKQWVDDCKRDAHPHILELISTRLPNLAELHINIDVVQKWEYLVKLKSVRRLHLHSSQRICYVSDLSSYLSVMPCLEGLNITAFSHGSLHLPTTDILSLDLESGPWTVSTLTTIVNACPKLERFRYYAWSRHTTNGEVLTWPRTQRILYPLRKTLKHVNFSDASFDCRNSDYLRFDLGSFRNFDGLETLWMDVTEASRNRKNRQIPKFPVDTADLIQMLPESLTLIYFYGLTEKWEGIEMLAQAIRGGHFPRLKTVVVQQAGPIWETSCKLLASVGVSCESNSDASANGRRIFPTGGLWECCDT